MLFVVVAAYHRYHQLPVLLHSFLAQTDGRWRMLVLHDGKDDRHAEIVARYLGGRIAYEQTEERGNCYGHQLRALGIARAPEECDWILLTNDDNYYAPVFVERMLAAAAVSPRPKLIACNMVHSHPQDWSLGSPGRRIRYGALKTLPVKFRIDVGAFIVRRQIAQAVGFQGRDHDADGDYLEACMRHAKMEGFVKVPGFLFVHN